MALSLYLGISFLLIEEVDKSSLEASKAYTLVYRLEHELKEVKHQKEMLKKAPCNATMVPIEPKITGAFSAWPQTRRKR